MYNSSNIQPTQNAFTQLAFIMFIYKTIQLQRFKHKNTYLHKSSSCNQLRRCNVPPNHRKVCSSISQKHCHPRAGHDSLRNKGQCRLTHSQGLPISQTHTLGFYQVIKELGQAKCQASGLNTSLLMHTQPLIPLSIVRRPTTTYRSKKIPSQICEEGKDNRVTIPNKR